MTGLFQELARVAAKACGASSSVIAVKGEQPSSWHFARAFDEAAMAPELHKLCVRAMGEPPEEPAQSGSRCTHFDFVVRSSADEHTERFLSVPVTDGKHVCLGAVCVWGADLLATQDTAVHTSFLRMIAQQVAHLLEHAEAFPHLENCSPSTVSIAGMDQGTEATSTSLRSAPKERLAHAIDGTNEGLWDWNIESGDVWFSDRWQTMLGYVPGEVEPHVRSWEHIVHPDDMSLVQEALAEHLEGRREYYETEHRVRCKNGSWLWILDRGKVVARALDGRPLRAVGTHKDISERKAQESARLALLHLQDALRKESTPDGVLWAARQSLVDWFGIADFNVVSQAQASQADLWPKRPTGAAFDICLSDEQARMMSATGGSACRPGLALTCVDVGNPVLMMASLDEANWTQLARETLEGALERIKAAFERVGLEQTVRESEARLRLALEAAGAGTWELDVQAQQARLSVESWAMFGITEMDPERRITPANWAELLHPEDRLAAFAAVDAAIALGKPYDVTMRVRVPGQQGIRWVRGLGRIVHDEKGKAVKLTGLNFDVSEARRAQAFLADTAASLELALHVGDMATFDWNVVTGDVRWSPGHYSMYGYEIGTIQPSYAAWAARIHPDDLPIIEERIQHARLTGEDYDAKYRVLRPGGTRVWVEARGRFLIDEHGRPSRLIGVMHDVTRRKDAEDMAEHVQRDMLRLSRLTAMGAMASTLAHELNQPLAAMANYLAAAHVVVRNPGCDVPAIAEVLVQCKQQTKRIGGIIKRIRSFTQSGQVTRVLAHPSNFIQAAVRPLSDRLIKADAVLNTHVDPSVRAIAVDELQIEQVVSNLLRNAIEAVQMGSTRIIDISVTAVEDDVYFVVGDTGPGFAEGHVDEVFNLFHSEKENGMGLGLPLCRTIVEAHGGRIWAVNRPKGGAEFTFVLPATLQAAYAA